MRDFNFSPAAITVNVGESVTWVNAGDEPHNAVGDGFSTPLLNPGKSASESFSSAGTFSYICTVHPQMKGTVKVVARGADRRQAARGHGLRAPAARRRPRPQDSAAGHRTAAGQQRPRRLAAGAGRGGHARGRHRAPRRLGPREAAAAARRARRRWPLAAPGPAAAGKPRCAKTVKVRTGDDDAGNLFFCKRRVTIREGSCVRWVWTGTLDHQVEGKGFRSKLRAAPYSYK